MAVSTKKVDESPSVLDNLKTQADIMGIAYNPKVTAKDLRKQLLASLAEDDDGDENTGEERQRIEREAMKLVRCIITPMDNQLKEHQGQIFTIGNSIIPMTAKFVLFDEIYHLPKIMVDHIKEQQMQYFVNEKRNGKTVRVSRMRKAYSVQELEPLTKEELAELARSQENRNAVDA